MSHKEELGEFSLDLYYNDRDEENPYTARVKFLFEDWKTKHARAKSFSEALEKMEYMLTFADTKVNHTWITPETLNH